MRNTSRILQDTLGYKNGHVFQALGRVRSRAQLDAHRIRLEYIRIRSEYAQTCILQQIAESEAEYDGIRVEYVTIRKESAKNAQLLALSTEGQCLKGLLVARVELRLHRRRQRLCLALAFLALPAATDPTDSSTNVEGIFSGRQNCFNSSMLVIWRHTVLASISLASMFTCTLHVHLHTLPWRLQRSTRRTKMNAQVT